MSDASAVVVIGGGVIGWSVARALALRGEHVVLVDRDQPGSASRAAAGMLSPLAETGDAGPLHDLADASLDLFPHFVADLERVGGRSVGYRTDGKLHTAAAGDDAGELQRLAASPHARRYGVELIEGDEARRLEPALGPEVHTALHVRRDHSVDNRLLHAALRTAGSAAGVEHREARAVACDASGGAVRGVRLENDAVVRCTAVVIAAGAWSGQIAGTAMLPVAPVRGQMLAVRAAESIFRRVIASPRCYLIPRADGRLLIGATVEDAGFEEGTTEAGMTALWNAAVQLAPGVAALPVTERWFGFRPGTPDGLPLLGEDERIERLFYATGHYRNGILLAPATAAAIAALIAGDQPPISLAAFSPGRFR